MGFFSRRMPGDMERSLWDSIPIDLHGRVTNLKEMQGLFPDFVDREIIILRTERDYAMYGIDVGVVIPLAYDCFNCNKLVIGPPRIEDDLSIEDGIPPQGEKGMICTALIALLT